MCATVIDNAKTPQSAFNRPLPLSLQRILNNAAHNSTNSHLEDLLSIGEARENSLSACNGTSMHNLQIMMKVMMNFTSVGWINLNTGKAQTRNNFRVTGKI